MNLSEIFHLPQTICNAVSAMHGGPWMNVICSTTVNTLILAALLFGAIRLFGPTRPGKRGRARRRES